MLAFHCLLLVLLAGQASADENKCQAQKDKNPVCITAVCKEHWPTKTDLNPAELMEAQKQFFDKDTFFDEWKLKQQPQIGECTKFKKTKDYRKKMNEIVDCKPWGNDKTWCLCGNPNQIPGVQEQCPTDREIEKRFNSADSCGGKALRCDQKSLYDVEHIIDRNGRESKLLDKGARALDMYGNVVMAWGAWNQELSGCAEIDYDKMQAEKKMIYGEQLWEKAVGYTKQCNEHQLDTQPSPGMSNAPLVHASLSDIFGEAAKNGHFHVVESLLASGQVDPNEPSLDGRTPLFKAAENGHFHVVGALLASGQVDPNEPSLDGRTPLFKAAENGHFHVVVALLASGQVNPDKPSLDGRTPLFKAAENGHIHVVVALLVSGQVNPDKPSLDGRTPLFKAAENGHIHVVEALLAHQNNRPTDHTASGSGSENGPPPPAFRDPPEGRDPKRARLG